MAMYIVTVSKLADTKYHHRETHVVDLPDTGTKAAAKTWFKQEIWPDVKEWMPNETLSSIRVDYIKMTQLDLP